MKVLNYSILLRKEPEGGYTVMVPSLPGCVTYGETIEEAIDMAKEAIEIYIESLKEHGEIIPTEEGGVSCEGIILSPHFCHSFLFYSHINNSDRKSWC